MAQFAAALAVRAADQRFEARCHLNQGERFAQVVIGAPAQAVVKKGDLVKVGTLLAKAGGFVSANIHSSVSGKVNKIDNALDASGYKRPAIYKDVEGDECEETIDTSETLVKECALSSKEIV